MLRTGRQGKGAALHWVVPPIPILTPPASSDGVKVVGQRMASRPSARARSTYLATDMGDSCKLTGILIQDMR